MRTSLNGISLIGYFEKYHGEIYIDPDGKKVIGYGHILKDNEVNIYDENGLSEEDAMELLKKDLNHTENVVSFYCETPLNQNQFDSLVSFVFNITPGLFRSSDMLKYINDEDFNKAAEEFKRWVNYKGKELPELVMRRQIEEELFRS